MEQLTYLIPAERPRMDAVALETLCADLGQYAAEDLVCRAMEEVAQRLSQFGTLAETARFEEKRKTLRALSAIAEQIGLTGVAQVARDVIKCIDAADPVAEAATRARLVRISDSSLTAFWDLQGLSI